MSANLLPHWAEDRVDPDDGIEKVYVNPNVAYPEILAALQLEVDQYGVEAAFRCVMKTLIEIRGKEVYIHIADAPAWSLKNIPEGRGAGAGAADSSMLYTRLKGLTGN